MTDNTAPDDDDTAQAEALWDKLQHDFLDAQATIIEIIDTRAWEPLGYESFAKAWIDRMADITLAAELLPHVVYELLKERSVEEVAHLVKGIGPEGVENLKRQQDEGIPAEQASPRRRPRTKRAHRFLTIEVEPELLATWKAKAEQAEKTVAEIVVAAATATFEAMP
jgi:hypothetical protein